MSAGAGRTLLKSFSITQIEAEITAFLEYDIKTGKIYETEWSGKFDRTSLEKKLISYMTKRHLREFQNKHTKIVVFFPCCDCPLEVLCDISKGKILSIFIYLKQKQLIDLWGIKTSIPSGKNGSVSSARRASHTINIFENNLILFHFSRLPG